MKYTMLLVNGHFTDDTAGLVRLEGLEWDELIQAMTLSLSKSPSCELVIWKEQNEDEPE